MNAVEKSIEYETLFTGISPILLSGDNPHASYALHEVLEELGFHTQLAPIYSQVESLWRNRRSASAAPVLVLLEVSQQQNVEAAVDTALQLKRQDPSQFVGYIADPALWVGGLIGDAVLPRNPGRLAESLRRCLSQEK